MISIRHITEFALGRVANKYVRTICTVSNTIFLDRILIEKYCALTLLPLQGIFPFNSEAGRWNL